MWSSEGKPADTGAGRQQLLNTTPVQWEQESEREQIFQLIDQFLSFEVCLYHQILPLTLQNNQLFLAMVHPEDSGALDYVSRIISYLNCTMVTQNIPADIHRTILSAYLNYKNTLRPDDKSEDTIDIPFLGTEQLSNQFSEQIISEKFSSASDNLAVEESQANPTFLPSDITVLQVQASELFSPIEALVNLAPKKLLEELLARVLGGGIGRLYLERQPYKGRIIWSDNGVLQSVLEDLPLSVFQGVLNELKRFASVPVVTVGEPQQVEKECQYQNNRLLLRIRVMPGINGEEATLQILRGAALKFYQQQQLFRLNRDVISISQQLSYKLHELQQRILLNPSLKFEQSEALSTLNRMVENLDQQIKILTGTNE